jgi:hypothetical protein
VAGTCFPSQKDDLDLAYRYAYARLVCHDNPVNMDPNGLTDEPMNVHPGVADDTQTAMESVTPSANAHRARVPEACFHLRTAISRCQFLA